MGNIARPLALDLQRNIGRSSVTPMLNPSAVAQRAASIRTAHFYDGQPAPVDPTNPPQQQAPQPTPYRPPFQFPQASQPVGYTPPQYVPPQRQAPYVPPAGSIGSWLTAQYQDYTSYDSPRVPGGNADAAQRREFAQTIDNLLAEQQRMTDLRAQSVAMNAALATASYDAQLQIIGQEIERYQGALSRVDEQWATWNAQAQEAIATAAAQTQAAYATYIDLLNQGFSDYEALTQSRYGEYQATVRALVGQYTAETNTSYQDFIASLPATYAPAVDAITTGNQAAVAAIHAETVKARNTVEGQVLESTSQFAAEMDRIGADNPALAQELLADLNASASLALEGIDLAGAHGAAMEAAAGEIAKRTVQYQLAMQMRASEEERVTLVNDAARQRHQLLTASEHELEGLLEQSGASRAQLLVEVNAALEAQLAGLDEASDRIRQESIDAAREMKFEISESIRNMVNQQFQTSTNRSTAYTGAVLDGWDPAQQAAIGANDLAATHMLNALDRFDTLRVNTNRRDSLAATVAGWFTDGSVASVADFDAARLDPESPLAGLPPEEITWLRAAVTAYASALDNYDEVYGPRSESGQPMYYAPLGSYDRVGDGFGVMRDSGPHGGIDVIARQGTPIHAVRGGTLTRYTNASAGFGVRIDHGDGTFSTYAHLNNWNGVPPSGTIVPYGTTIGQVGNTGNSNTPHLHFQFLIGQTKVDPVAAGVWNP